MSNDPASQSLMVAGLRPANTTIKHLNRVLVQVAGGPITALKALKRCAPTSAG